MRALALTSLLVAGLWATASPAAPQVQSLGTSGRIADDPAAACRALTAAPWDNDTPKSGLPDAQVALDEALAACTAAHDAAPDDMVVATGLARTMVLRADVDAALPLLESASGSGYAPAQFILAGLYVKSGDTNVPYDPDQGASLLAAAAAAGYVPALMELAAGVDDPVNPPDYDKARQYYEIAADKGEPHALYRLGYFYHYGLAVTADADKARGLYQRAADAGNGEGWFGIGQLAEGDGSDPAGQVAAIAAYQKGADLGDPIAETSLAYFYGEGIGVEKDKDKSFALLTAAADKDYAYAKAALSLHYLYGEGTAVDWERAFTLANEAANGGVGYAHGIVGYMRDMGYGTPRDLDEALQSYQFGAEAGDIYSSNQIEAVKAEIACAELAASPHEGAGLRGVEFDSIDAEPAIAACRSAVEINPDSIGNKVWLGRALAKAGQYEEAIGLLDEGRADGNPLALTVSADLLRVGQGVPADPVGAFALYRQAADLGFVPAILAMGDAYAHGDGVPSDPAMARQWYGKALEMGADAAREALAALDGSDTTTPVDLTGFARADLAYALDGN